MRRGLKYLSWIAVGAVAPLLVGLAGGYWLHMLIIATIFASLTVSLNLIMGYTGQINLAHVSFFGIGAYSSALLCMNWNVNCWLALFFGAIVAVVLSLVLGYISLGLREIYFAIATFAFLMLVSSVLTNLDTVTGGSRGLLGIPNLTFAGFVFAPAKRLAWFYLVFSFLLLNLFVVSRVVHSRIGTALIAIREDEGLAESTGINTYWYKMLSFMVSAFLAAGAGGLFVFYMGTMTPADCSINPAIMVIAMCAIGGLGTMVGPLLGAMIVTLLPEVLRPIEDYYYLAFGFIIVLITIFAPAGCMGAFHSLRQSLESRHLKK